MKNTLSDFTEVPFPASGEIVYVLCFVRPGHAEHIPFYVGESTRHIGRFGDYVSGKFTAQTDFKIGEAVKCFRELDCQVLIKFKETTSRRSDEASLIALLKGQRFKLLNELKGYKYLSAVEKDERYRIHCFVKSLVRDSGNESHAS